MPHVTSCEFPGCNRPTRSAGSAYCNGHYQQYRTAGFDHNALRPLRDQGAPGSVHREGWSPPGALSAQWFARVKRDALRRESVDARECSLEACGGIAVRGSKYCAAHKAYRDAQERWARRMGER